MITLEEMTSEDLFELDMDLAGEVAFVQYRASFYGDQEPADEVEALHQQMRAISAEQARRRAAH
jgi:hypothetical protein